MSSSGCRRPVASAHQASEKSGRIAPHGTILTTRTMQSHLSPLRPPESPRPSRPGADGPGMPPWRAQTRTWHSPGFAGGPNPRPRRHPAPKICAAIRDANAAWQHCTEVPCASAAWAYLQSGGRWLRPASNEIRRPLLLPGSSDPGGGTNLLPGVTAFSFPPHHLPPLPARFCQPQPSGRGAQNGTSSTRSAGMMNFATTFLVPALSKRMSSLSPSIAAIWP